MVADVSEDPAEVRIPFKVRLREPGHSGTPRIRSRKPRQKRRDIVLAGLLRLYDRAEVLERDKIIRLDQASLRDEPPEGLSDEIERNAIRICLQRIAHLHRSRQIDI